MIPKKLAPQIVNLINERINDEYGHHYFYKQVANYCENAGYMKAAKYFHQESHEEVEHAEMLQKYLTDWNIQPSLAPIEPPAKVKSLVEALELAYAKEYELYKMYEETSGEIFKDGDYATFDFLSKFRAIQLDAVATYSTFLNQLELIDQTDKNWVYMFEQKAFKV